jgi:flavin reductase (DIM6/NTAB) family NADH-FMN oxidoreductase RutF
VIVFDPTEHPPARAQALLSQLVAPRPIAMISTADADGIPNVAPFSYYMPITGNPMLIAVSMGLRESDGQPKHTFENATRAGDFVINVTTQSFRDHIETAAIEFPRGVSEFDAAGWTVVPSIKVSSPSVAESPAHLECRIHELIELGNESVRFSEVTLVVAEVVCVALDASICTADYRVDVQQLGLIGRMGVPWFTSATPASMFELPRYTYSEHAKRGEGRE